MKISFQSITKLCFITVIIFNSLFFYSQNSYDFLVGGHAYGDHLGTNNGLHPPFLVDLQDHLINNNPDFIVLAGDIVRTGTSTQWNEVANELEDLNLPSYYVMGNHDNTAEGISVFEEKHGNTFYSFMQGPDLFIVLNQEISYRSISSSQVLYLEEQLNSNTYRNVFLFFHMLLWNGDGKYSSVESNLGSQYSLMSPYSNYWEDVYPILNEYNEHDIYIITGDVGGRPEVISSFYDRCGHIRMIATGMGEAPEENFMTVEVTEDDVLFSLIPLDENITLGPLEEQTYTLPLVFDLTPQEDVHLCEGEDVTFEVLMNEGFSFFWSVEDVDVNNTSLFYNTDEENTYSFIATDETCIVTEVRDVFVHEPITTTPVITFNNSELTCNCTEEAQWYFEDNPIGDATDLTLFPSDFGNYTVACSNGGCLSEQSDEFNYNYSAIDDLNNTEVNVSYHSQSNSIVISNASKYQHVIIYDLQGKIIKQENAASNIKFKKEGVYFVRLISDSGSFSQRILIP